jgi:hypothetical protein
MRVAGEKFFPLRNWAHRAGKASDIPEGEGGV